MMYWSDVATAQDLAQFFVDFDPYGAGDADICDENDSTKPSAEFLFEITCMAEDDPDELIYELNEMYSVCGDEPNCNKIIGFIEWLETMIEQKEAK